MANRGFRCVQCYFYFVYNLKLKFMKTKINTNNRLYPFVIKDCLCIYKNIK